MYMKLILIMMYDCVMFCMRMFIVLCIVVMLVYMYHRVTKKASFRYNFLVYSLYIRVVLRSKTPKAALRTKEVIYFSKRECFRTSKKRFSK